MIFKNIKTIYYDEKDRDLKSIKNQLTDEIIDRRIKILIDKKFN